MQLSLQKQKWNEESSHAYETCSKSGAASSKDPSRVNRKRSRERAYATDRVCIDVLTSLMTSMLFIIAQKNKTIETCMDRSLIVCYLDGIVQLNNNLELTSSVSYCPLLPFSVAD